MHVNYLLTKHFWWFGWAHITFAPGPLLSRTSSLKQLIKKGRGNGPLKPWQPFRITRPKEGANSIPTSGREEISQRYGFESLVTLSYLKPILTYRVGFFIAITFLSWSLFLSYKKIRTMKSQLLHLFTKPVMINYSAILFPFAATCCGCCMC